MHQLINDIKIWSARAAQKVGKRAGQTGGQIMLWLTKDVVKTTAQIIVFLIVGVSFFFVVSIFGYWAYYNMRYKIIAMPLKPLVQYDTWKGTLTTIK